MRGGTPGEAAPQEAAVLRALHGALALIHLQLEATAEAPTPTGHHPFTSAQAAHLDMARIGVATKPADFWGAMRGHGWPRSPTWPSVRLGHPPELPGSGHVRSFLFVGSHLCYTLPSDPKVSP